MATKVDLATRALQALNIVAAEETPLAGDGAFAREKVQAVHDDLTEREIADWGVDVVPESAAEGYALMAASLMVVPFGVKGVDPEYLWRRGERLVIGGTSWLHDKYRRTQAEYL